jgi:putative oxidoreductase
MTNSNSFYSVWSPYLLSILRIVAALLFMEHGSQKLFGFPPSPQAASGSLPLLLLAAGVLEFFGGLLLLLGLFTRPVAFILSGQMAVAYFKAHASHVLYCFLFLYLAVAGGGSWSLDNLRGRGGT